MSSKTSTTDVRSFGLKPLLLGLAFYLLVLLGITGWDYRDSRRESVDRVDQRLEIFARLVPAVLPERFAEESFRPLDVSPEEDALHTEILTRFADRFGVDHLFTLIRREGDFHITAFSASSEEGEEGRNVRYFEPYPEADPAFHQVLDSGGAAAFTHRDRWGAFRSVAVPVDTASGQRYLAVAELEIDQLGAGLHRIWAVHATNGLLLLLGGLPLFYLFLRREQRLHEDRLRIEVQARNAQRMEAVGRLAGGVAHDFNNMVGVMMGAADAARLKHHRGLPVVNELEQIQQAASRSADITRQLLAFARENKSAPEILDLNDCVDRSLKMIRRLIGEEIHLVWQPDSDVKSILADPTHLDQILINLCLNARDAIEGDGLILISTETLRVETPFHTGQDRVEPGRYTCLTVTDNGAGIPSEILDKVMEPFFTTKEEADSAGLGLATVYGLMRQVDGYVRVESGTEEGTRVDLLFPHAETPREEADAVGMDAVPLGEGETVMLVDDHPMMRELMSGLLDGLGYTVVRCDDPAKAEELARALEEPIDLLVTDVVMPGLNGLEVRERVAAVHPEMRTLFMTGYDLAELKRRGIDTGGMKVISKPFTRGELAAAVRKALE